METGMAGAESWSATVDSSHGRGQVLIVSSCLQAALMFFARKRSMTTSETWNTRSPKPTHPPTSLGGCSRSYPVPFVYLARCYRSQTAETVASRASASALQVCRGQLFVPKVINCPRRPQNNGFLTLLRRIRRWGSWRPSTSRGAPPIPKEPERAYLVDVALLVLLVFLDQRPV
ncbi:hypothetical protein P171DRAFT_114264 [Karstenula rhodostoma CBS 690.94]|uniref:Uncharacterized protein n=1 Tax=Karstenula rhodostoma CBS 690.94 TaxID=1392251 RepID=A0A9P4PAK9_9PLEO|nr:hypothetical protein P171DRAFT_114264 [Karstenula rhodostoma CBS 690.94]